MTEHTVKHEGFFSYLDVKRLGDGQKKKEIDHVREISGGEYAYVIGHSLFDPARRERVEKLANEGLELFAQAIELSKHPQEARGSVTVWCYPDEVYTRRVEIDHSYQFKVEEGK